MKGVDILSFTDDKIPYISASNKTKLVEDLGGSTHLRRLQIIKWMEIQQKRKLLQKLTQLKMKTANLKSY